MQTRLSLSLIGAGLSLAALAPGEVSAATASGGDLYSNYCQSCHGAARSPWGLSATTIRSAIDRNRGGMGSLSFLTDGQLTEIATYLADPTGSTTIVADSGSTTATATATDPASEADQVFDWAEATYPFLFSGSSGSQSLAGYYFRHYPARNVYLAVFDGRLYFYDDGRPQDGMLDLGSLTEWSARAAGNTTTAATGSDSGSSTSGSYGDDSGYTSGAYHPGGDDEGGYEVESHEGHHHGDSDD